MESLDNCTDDHFFFIIGLTGASGSVFSSSHCTDELYSGIVGSSGAKLQCTDEYNLLIIGLTGDSKLSLFFSF